MLARSRDGSQSSRVQSGSSPVNSLIGGALPLRAWVGALTTGTTLLPPEEVRGGVRVTAEAGVTTESRSRGVTSLMRAVITGVSAASNRAVLELSNLSLKSRNLSVLSGNSLIEPR